MLIVLCKSHFLKVTTLIEMENEFFVKHDLFVLKRVHTVCVSYNHTGSCYEWLKKL